LEVQEKLAECLSSPVLAQKIFLIAQQQAGILRESGAIPRTKEQVAVERARDAAIEAERAKHTIEIEELKAAVAEMQQQRLLETPLKSATAQGNRKDETTILRFKQNETLGGWSDPNLFSDGQRHATEERGTSPLKRGRPLNESPSHAGIASAADMKKIKSKSQKDVLDTMMPDITELHACIEFLRIAVVQVMEAAGDDPDEQQDLHQTPQALPASEPSKIAVTLREDRRLVEKMSARLLDIHSSKRQKLRSSYLRSKEALGQRSRCRVFSEDPEEKAVQCELLQGKEAILGTEALDYAIVNDLRVFSRKRHENFSGAHPRGMEKQSSAAETAPHHTSGPATPKQMLPPIIQGDAHLAADLGVRRLVGSSASPPHPLSKTPQPKSSAKLGSDGFARSQRVEQPHKLPASVVAFHRGVMHMDDVL
jgi:hypothetical protein